MHRYRGAAHCACFNDADTVIIAPVYPAGEQPIPGADRDALVTGLRARGHKQAMPLEAPVMNTRGCMVDLFNASTRTMTAAAE